MDTFKWVVALILAASTFIAALAVLWKTLRQLFRIDKALPVLLQIAHEFQNNSGSTMKDKLDTVIKQGDEQAVRNNWAVKIAEDSRLIAQTNAKIVEELTGTQTADLIAMKEYLHSEVNQLNNNVSLINLQAAVTEQRSARIEARLDEIIPLVVRHRKEDNE